MSLDIKLKETHRLVQELAHLTGESVMLAVIEAVRKNSAVCGGSEGLVWRTVWWRLARTVRRI